MSDTNNGNVVTLDLTQMPPGAAIELMQMILTDEQKAALTAQAQQTTPGEELHFMANLSPEQRELIRAIAIAPILEDAFLPNEPDQTQPNPKKETTMDDAPLIEQVASALSDPTLSADELVQLFREEAKVVATAAANLEQSNNPDDAIGAKILTTRAQTYGTCASLLEETLQARDQRHLEVSSQSNVPDEPPIASVLVPETDRASGATGIRGWLENRALPIAIYGGGVFAAGLAVGYGIVHYVRYLDRVVLEEENAREAAREAERQATTKKARR